MFGLLSYRKKVVVSNIKASFPDKSDVEVKEISREFYKFFCDFIVESIKCFSISEKESLKRCNLKNPEILDSLYKQGRSVVMACGHYNNWEMAAGCVAKSLKHDTCALYKPLKNKFFDKKFGESRSKFGIKLVSKYDAKAYIKENINKPIMLGFGSDQCPKKGKQNLFWTKFLNQDTAIMFGTEKYAVEFGLGVVFVKINKIKRGYYQAELVLITDNAANTKYGFVSKKHTQLLEEQIIENPSNWLWTHKRWKLKKQEHEVCH